DFDKKVKDFQKQFNDVSPFKKLDDKEAREKYLTARMGALAKQYGLSEQTMKALVTQRMGQIYNEGAAEMGAASQEIVGPLRKQLAEVERTKGPGSAEAVALRERIAKLDKAAGPYTQHLGQVGETYKSLFPVPPSFAEGFIDALKTIGDV